MVLYSIGHSNVEIGVFLDLLRRHNIETLVDSRSQPYSRYSPQFNKEALSRATTEAGVDYVYMGDALGGRPEGGEFYYGSGKVDYALLAESPSYLSGIDRLLDLAKTRRVAFLCSEADFKNCHRYKLITRTLVGRGVDVSHITHSGELVDSHQSEFEPDQLSLF
jgi:uncharacterized protein (DUF488 family)